MKCAWWVVVQKHAPRPCGALAVGKRQDVPSCKRHLRGPLPVVAVVADTIGRALNGARSLSEADRAALLRQLVADLGTPL